MPTLLHQIKEGIWTVYFRGPVQSLLLHTDKPHHVFIVWQLMIWKSHLLHYFPQDNPYKENNEMFLTNNKHAVIINEQQLNIPYAHTSLALENVRLTNTSGLAHL
jgi:hypothetical protein